MSLWLLLRFDDLQEPFLSSFIYKCLIRCGTTLEPSGSNIRIIFVQNRDARRTGHSCRSPFNHWDDNLPFESCTLQRNFVQQQASDLRYNNVLGKWGHEGYALHEQRTLSRRWNSSVLLQLSLLFCVLGRRGQTRCSIDTRL